MERLFETGTTPFKRTAVPVDQEPLAARMRPSSLADFVGQRQLIGEGCALREAIEHGRLMSMIFYGPPGTGKTTLARIIARSTAAAFEEISAVNAGRQQVREVIDRAEQRRATAGKPTIFFLDEIHRFNKAQQDTLLPAVEEGLITLIGATTENPFFEVNSALMSRCRLFEFKPLTGEQLETVLGRALKSKVGARPPAAEIDRAVITFLTRRSNGDARTALNALELAAETARELKSPMTIELAQAALQQSAVLYDKEGDHHYDYISAFIKSLRGSDPDAAVYYLAVMLQGGEDPRFVARRMVIFASEDVGNADPRALELAVAAAHAVDHVGMPECRINLCQAATYLALAPKSNAAITAIDSAWHDVAERGAELPPNPLRDAGYRGAKELGRGIDYDYPHSHPDAVSDQRYLPEGMEKRRYYHPADRGDEADLLRRLEELRRRRKR